MDEKLKEWKLPFVVKQTMDLESATVKKLVKNALNSLTSNRERPRLSWKELRVTTGEYKVTKRECLCAASL